MRKCGKSLAEEEEEEVGVLSQNYVRTLTAVKQTARPI